MFEIRKVTPDENPKACEPVSCSPNTITCSPITEVSLCNPSQQVACNPSSIVQCIPNITICVPSITLLKRKVSGTYRSPTPSGWGTIIELRVDVDGRRPQNRLSADVFLRYYFWGYGFTIYLYSFVVNSLTATEVSGEMVITGPIVYYSDSSKVSDTIEVRIPRVSLYALPADATVKLFTSGSLTGTFVCPKTSEYYRTVTLEIDRFQGTTFPPTANTHVNPHPADLTNENITTALVFQRAGINMTVTEDDVLNDPDSTDIDSNWDEGELHDLMEDRYDLFANTLQWNVYGVVVPKFGDPYYDSGYYGVMFDWGGWQTGDIYFRQGSAVAYDAIQGRTSGTLYDSTAKKNRLFLETFIHEIGHAFNLPHSWQRSANPSLASQSFMNYPWKYTGGSGTTSSQKENDFWSDFRWEFDDVELIWMRHGDRNDVIFGGRDWIGNNLSIYTEPQMERRDAPLSLEVRAWDVFEFAQPVRVELKLKNVSNSSLRVSSLLEPEDGFVTLYIKQPNGDIVRYIPPVRRLKDPKEVELAPGESIYETVILSYGAKGPFFQTPGEYRIRAYYELAGNGMIVSPACRLRVANPVRRSTEELAYILFSREGAKFLYFGGTERYPELTSRLKEAVEKYARTEPTVVRHIQAALGQHLARPFKHVTTKGERRVIVRRDASLDEATVHLEAARSPLPVTRVSALDHITYNRMSKLLAECYQQQGKTSEAVRILKQSLNYLQRRRVVKTVLDDYRVKIKELSQ